MPKFEFKSFTIPESPNFNDFPWELPINEWSKDRVRMEEVQHGISRHPVVFINYWGNLYVLKELPSNLAKIEYELLCNMNEHHLPCVKPMGYATLKRESNQSSILFTKYLDASLPYRLLFINKSVKQYQKHLLDAISGLLVQLHSNGFYWGDCSLSNILFRRDAGALQAYLVDAETAEYHLPPLSPVLRYHDLEIMEENIAGELIDLQTSDSLAFKYPIEQTGPYVQQRYRNLWEEISREDIFSQSELYRVEERIRKLNSLGFSVKDIKLVKVEQGDILKLRIFVSDRNFHRNQLMELTGLYAEEKQAQQIINEIFELKAKMSQTNYPEITLEAIAYHWIENVYKPVLIKLQSYVENNPGNLRAIDFLELYCQVLEHKWYLSEQAHHDVGHIIAVDDFIQDFSDKL
jgi:tRNA A-37 threonylcarbamoyl transferase component Bud32